MIAIILAHGITSPNHEKDIVARKINARKQSGVLLKLDISRAFDTVSWAFLLEVLHKMGFSEAWIRWTALMLYTASTMVLVNGVSGKRIHHFCHGNGSDDCAGGDGGE